MGNSPLKRVIAMGAILVCGRALGVLRLDRAHRASHPCVQYLQKQVQKSTRNRRFHVQWLHINMSNISIYDNIFD